MTASRQASPDTDGVMCAKGTVNILEDLVCQDYLCLTVNYTGISADVLTCRTSFVPG